MDEVRIRETGETLSKERFQQRLAESNVSVPDTGLSSDALDFYGADILMEGPHPIGEAWQSVQRAGEAFDGTHWIKQYVLSPVFDNQEDEDAYVAGWNANNLKASTPETISDRQFFQALWELDYISYEEAEAAVETGAIPAQMELFVQMLEDQGDPTQARRVRLLIKGATTYERSNQVVPVFAYMYGMTDEQVDALWRTAAAL